MSVVACPACLAELEVVDDSVRTVPMDCHDFPVLDALSKLTLCGECGLLFGTAKDGTAAELSPAAWAELRRHPAAGIIRAAQDRTVRLLYG